ncbi:PPE family protein, SVP subgroup [Mycobacterium uberis]|nr:hypothetical protein [Mycobacterium uberis]
MAADLGEASVVGDLSVPASWSAATPVTLTSSTAPPVRQWLNRTE